MRSALEAGWDGLFALLEAGRCAAAQGVDAGRVIEGDRSGGGNRYGTASGEMGLLKGKRDTDYSMDELEDAVRKMNVANGTATTVDDVLERVRDMGLSG